MCCDISGLVRCDKVSEDTVVQLHRQYPLVFLSTVFTEMTKVFNKAGNLLAVWPPGIPAAGSPKWEFIEVRSHLWIGTMTRYERADGLNIGYTSLLYGLHADMTSKAIRGQNQCHHILLLYVYTSHFLSRVHAWHGTLKKRKHKNSLTSFLDLGKVWDLVQLVTSYYNLVFFAVLFHTVLIKKDGQIMYSNVYTNFDGCPLRTVSDD